MSKFDGRCDTYTRHADGFEQCIGESVGQIAGKSECIACQAQRVLDDNAAGRPAMSPDASCRLMLAELHLRARNYRDNTYGSDPERQIEQRRSGLIARAEQLRYDALDAGIADSEFYKSLGVLYMSLAATDRI